MYFFLWLQYRSISVSAHDVIWKNEGELHDRFHWCKHDSIGHKHVEVVLKQQKIWKKFKIAHSHEALPSGNHYGYYENIRKCDNCTEQWFDTEKRRVFSSVSRCQQTSMDQIWDLWRKNTEVWKLKKRLTVVHEHHFTRRVGWVCIEICHMTIFTCIGEVLHAVLQGSDTCFFCSPGSSCWAILEEIKEIKSRRQPSSRISATTDWIGCTQHSIICLDDWGQKLNILSIAYFQRVSSRKVRSAHGRVRRRKKGSIGTPSIRSPVLKCSHVVCTLLESACENKVDAKSNYVYLAHKAIASFRNTINIFQHSSTPYRDKWGTHELISADGVSEIFFLRRQ